jgi:hypothetical protein
VAFLRFSRDKRGYEHFCLVQPSSRGKGRPRVLYWFRTPPNVKIGRAPFDPEIQRALESHNPDVAFDWTAIVRTPIPPPTEPEHWRERRRAERAMRAAAEAEPADDAESREIETQVPPEPPNSQVEADVTAPASPSESGPSTATALTTSEGTAAGGESAQASGVPRRRRRRRRRKPQRDQAVQGTPAREDAPQVLPPDEPEDGV